jgi:hypothetical protein
MAIIGERSTFCPLFICASAPSEDMVRVSPVEPRGMVRGAARVLVRRERVVRRVVSEYMITVVEVILDGILMMAKD